MFFNDKNLLICGLDHGFSTMKGTHVIFDNGVEQLGGEATLSNNTLIYNGKYYKVGEGRLPMMKTKTEDESYFLLTLAGVAKELDVYHKQSAEALIQCMESIKSSVYQICNKKVREDIIRQIIVDGNAMIPEDCKSVIQDGLRNFAKGIEAKLSELGFDLEMMPVVYAGGGAMVMKRYGTIRGNHVHYLEDIRANARGYEYLARQKCKL